MNGVGGCGDGDSRVVKLHCYMWLLPLLSKDNTAAGGGCWYQIALHKS